MKRPDFQEKTEVKIKTHDKYEYVRVGGVERRTDMYGWRGRVTKITGLKDRPELAGTGRRYEEVEKPYTPENYPDTWWVDVSLKSPVDGTEYVVTFDDWESQLEPVQHKFVDIDYIREEDLVIGKKEDGTDAIRPKNTGAFEPGDLISITTKIDGANASIAWDETTGKLEAFSRTNLLDQPGSLRGFYDYVKTEIEPKTDWSAYRDFVFFGEWCVKHSVTYNPDWYNKWRVYDIWCKSAGCYVSQERVKATCRQLGLEYIEELYYGPFVSWDHCRSFIGKSKAYGPEQEGVVIKNQDKLAAEDRTAPAYIKIVDERFKESHKVKAKRELSPEEAAAKERGTTLAASVVTEARVRKIILKLVDEGKLPSELGPKDMGAVMKQLPKLAFDDVLKEEPETVKAIGDGAGKFIAAEAAKHARRIVVGDCR